MPITTEVKKLAESKPFYAVAGAGDFAVEKLTELPERIQRLQSRREEIRDAAKDLPEKARELAGKAEDYAKDFPGGPVTTPTSSRTGPPSSTRSSPSGAARSFPRRAGMPPWSWRSSPRPPSPRPRLPRGAPAPRGPALPRTDPSVRSRPGRPPVPGPAPAPRGGSFPAPASFGPAGLRAAGTVPRAQPHPGLSTTREGTSGIRLRETGEANVLERR